MIGSILIVLKCEIESEAFDGKDWRFAIRPDSVGYDLIVIPSELRGRPIAELNISVRLHNVLASNNLQLLGDLHGLPFHRFGALRNCGRKSLLELRGLVRGLQNGEHFSVPHASKRSHFILIPDGAFEFRPSDLPISARLASILQYMDVQRLGDLDGREFIDLLKVKNCGRITLKEFANLLKRTETGEFQIPADTFFPQALTDVIGLLDKRLMEMSPRDREVLLLRFDASAGQMLPFTAIASKLQLSRERIRQIVKKKLVALIKTGGPRLLAYLQGIDDLCHQFVCPLTIMLLTHWVAQYSVKHQFPLPFYVRLLGQLNHDIPVWPNGQEPCDHKLIQLHSISTQIENDLGNRAASQTTKKAFKLAKQSMPDLSCDQFFAAIRYARTLVVEFDNPEQPRIRLGGIQ